MALFSGEKFEDLIAGLTWPCTLPLGWSVEWEGSSAGADASSLSDVSYGLYRDVKLSLVTVFLPSAE